MKVIIILWFGNIYALAGGGIMQGSKRVIIFDNIQSARISQAIFILADEAADDFSAVKEAERLVEDFLGGEPLLIKKKGGKMSAVWITLLAFIAAVIAALIYIF